MKVLESLGWDSSFDKDFEQYKAMGFDVGRVGIEFGYVYLVYNEKGEYLCEPTGKLLYDAESPAEHPKVGDWVAVSIFEDEEKGIIHAILPRRSKFSRRSPGKKTEEQVVAANVDVIFIVQGLDDNFNLRRLERSLVLVYEGGAQPVVLLNKADLCINVEEKFAEVKRIAPNVEVLAMSAKNDFGIEQLQSFIKTGMTFAFIGSSGVGKSTMVNKLIGKEVQRTFDVKNDYKGRHTTTRRELIVLPEGGVIIDTPGMREIQLWSAGDGLRETFSDIEEIGINCRFKDCTHIHEIKCAVLEAIKRGEFPLERYESYINLKKEIEALEEDQALVLEKKRKTKVSQRAFNKIKKKKF